MLDDFRDEGGDFLFDDEEDEPLSFDDIGEIDEDYDEYDDPSEDPAPREPKKPRRRSTGPFLGMTPPQRALIAFMIMMLTCILSTLCLLVTERIVL